MKKTLNLKNQNSNGLLELTTDDNIAKLYFYGDIANESWQSECYAEDKCPDDIKEFLADLNSNAKLEIHINSCGGSVFGGLAIYNMLKRHKGEKIVYIDGIAASIASVIAMAGDKIIIPRNAFLMIHKPLISCYLDANADDLRKQADILDVCQTSILSIYSNKIKNNVELAEVEKMINAETWLIGDEVARYFDVQVINNFEAVACSISYKYKNAPMDFKQQKQKIEERKAKILRDLELI